MSFLTGSSGSSGPTLPLIRGQRAQSPGFNIRSNDIGEGIFRTRLERAGTFPQRAFDERFPNILSGIDTLRGTLTPGFSQLRDARLQQVENARSRGIGNLRDSLSRRRVLGSSFGGDAQIRAEAEFAQAASQQEAQSFLEELEANTQLINLESEQLFNALNRELAEIGLATNFATQTSDLVSRNAQFERSLAAEEAAGRGQLQGNLLGLGVSSVFGGLDFARSAGAFGPLAQVAR